MAPALGVAVLAAIAATFIAVRVPDAVSWSGIAGAAGYGMLLGIVGTVIAWEKPGQDTSRIPEAVRHSRFALGMWLGFGMAVLQVGRAWVFAEGQTTDAAWWFARCASTCAILLAASVGTLVFQQLILVGGKGR